VANLHRHLKGALQVRFMSRSSEQKRPGRAERARAYGGPVPGPFRLFRSGGPRQRATLGRPEGHPGGRARVARPDPPRRAGPGQPAPGPGERATASACPGRRVLGAMDGDARGTARAATDGGGGVPHVSVGGRGGPGTSD